MVLRRFLDGSLTVLRSDSLDSNFIPYNSVTPNTSRTLRIRLICYTKYRGLYGNFVFDACPVRKRREEERGGERACIRKKSRKEKGGGRRKCETLSLQNLKRLRLTFFKNLGLMFVSELAFSEN